MTNPFIALAKRLSGPATEPRLFQSDMRIPLNLWQKEIFAVWRVMLGVTFAQMTGACIGVALALHGHAPRISPFIPPGATAAIAEAYPLFVAAWLGGVFATPIGFLAGLAWEFSSPNRRTNRHREVLTLFGLICVPLVLAAVVVAVVVR